MEDLKDHNNRICVTLWRDIAEMATPEVDSTILLKNVYSKPYLNVVNFNSTQQTRLEVS